MRVGLPIDRQGEGDLGDDVAIGAGTLEQTVAIAEGAIGGGEGDEFAGVAVVGAQGMEPVLDLDTVCANVLDGRGAHRAGNQREVFQPRQAMRHRVGDQAMPRFAGACGDGVDCAAIDHASAGGDARNLHQQHQAFEIACEHDIAATAQHQHRQALHARVGQRGGNVVRRANVGGIARSGLETERVVLA